MGDDVAPRKEFITSNALEVANTRLGFKMNFSTLFRLEENLHLDKKTLVNLRWIAIIGQLIAINFVHFYLKLDLPYIETHIIIFIGLITNIVLQFNIRTNQLKDLLIFFFLFMICYN